MELKRVFNLLSAEDRDSSLVDWTVLLFGIVFLAVSVAPAVAVIADKTTEPALDHAVSAEDWLPS